MKKDTELNKKKLLDALERHKGIVLHACRECNLSRETFYKYLKEDDQFKMAVDHVNEGTIDYVEGKLMDKISEGSEKSIHFFLRFKAKSRGYTDSLDITTDGESINDVEIRIVKGRDDDEDLII